MAPSSYSEPNHQLKAQSVPYRQACYTTCTEEWSLLVEHHPILQISEWIIQTASDVTNSLCLKKVSGPGITPEELSEGVVTLRQQ